MMKKRYIPLLVATLLLGIISWNASGQRKPEQKTVTIQSAVIDESGAPVPDAVISGKEGAVEVTSGPDGKFTIEVPENSDILIEAKGFDNIVLPSAAVASRNVTLKKVPFLMDETNIVNYAFGKIRKKETVGALSVIDPKEIVKYDNSQFIYDGLRSRVSGMIGNTNVRGIGDAIFIVDGVPRDASNINIEEVDQITVLKDANTAVLWGSQAKNGVIIITTKRGQAFKRKINFSIEQGSSFPVVYPEYLGSAEYMSLYNEALANDGQPAAYPDSIIAFYAAGTNPYRYPDVDYYSSEFLKSSKPFTKFLTEFSGGNASTQYYANMGWMHSGGLYKLGEGSNTKADRFNIRGNVDFKINNYIKSFIDAVVIIDGGKGPLGSFWSNAATLQPQYFSPLLPVSLVKSNAVMAGGASLLTALRFNKDYILGGTSQYTNNVYGNMIRAGYTQNIRRTARFNAGVDVDLKGITEGLKLKTYLSLDVFNGYTQSVNNTYAIYQPAWTTYSTGDSISSLNKVGTDLSTGVQNLGDGGYYRRFGTYATLEYARAFNELHSITATFLGYFDNLNTNAVIIDQKNSHLGLRITYDFKKKYLIDFSNALVNGFKLEKGNKAGLSPSLGFAWVLSDESFLSGISVINYLKLRASASIINYEWTGSNYRLYESTFGSSTTYYWYDAARNITSTVISRSANPDLTFEKMKNINVGLEGYFLNRLISVDANVFTTLNSGQVIRRSIYASYVGSNYPWENYNDTRYSGAEIGLVLSKSLGDFSFDFGANMLYANSNVVKRDELWTDEYQYRQGRPNDALFGLEALGLFANQDDINNSPSQKFGEVRPGDIKYKDQNGDNIIDASDEVQIGNSLPRIAYGLSLNLKYKNFSLFAIGNGRNGSESYYSNPYYWVQGNVKYSEEVLNRWTPATASTATFPRLSSINSPNNFRNSTFWLYKDDYFTLDRVQLTFDIPENISRVVKSKDISVYLRGENLIRFSEDADKRQMQFGAEPLYRNYALGLRIMF